MTFRIREDQRTALKIAAAKQGTSIQAILPQLIDEYLLKNRSAKGGKGSSDSPKK